MGLDRKDEREGRWWRAVSAVVAGVSLVVCIVSAGFWLRSLGTKDSWKLDLLTRKGDVVTIKHGACSSDDRTIILWYSSQVINAARDPGWHRWPRDGETRVERQYVVRPAEGRAAVEPDRFLGFLFRRSRTGGYLVFIPHWFLVLVSATPPVTWLLVRRRRARRAAAGRCPACGYDLRATPDRCPECGFAAASSNSKAASVAPQPRSN